jgi:ribosomal protein S14
VKEKFPGESVERAQVKLREEKVYADAQRCPQCARVRAETKDSTALCERHLREVMGL